MTDSMALQSTLERFAMCFRENDQDVPRQVFNIPKSTDSLAAPDRDTSSNTSSRQNAVSTYQSEQPGAYKTLGLRFKRSKTKPQEHLQLLKSIRYGVIGEGRVFDGPFGERRITYADYTASGRSLSFIEDYIRQQILPFYANTHSEASFTGRRMNQLQQSARQIIHSSVGGGSEDVVIALGSGSTAAINRIVGVLGLRASTTDAIIPEDQRAVVFVGPFEHHSNELPWRESTADVVRIGLDSSGHIDQSDLRQKLNLYSKRYLKIGSFSAASNVTGILSDVNAITSLLHQHGALSFWDYAAAAPYVHIDMNPDRNDPSGLRNKDAIFISSHKFVGGPGTPGLLVAKKSLFRNTVPSVPGGGTVKYVTPDAQVYLSDVVQREEGGTPDIVGIIRAGLIFQLKDKVGAATIEDREQKFVKAAIKHWREHPRIHILGNLDQERLSIVSFNIKDSQGQPLHHNFIVALLNDLFGIQVRGGCSCAGPYGYHLLNIDEATSKRITSAPDAVIEGLKPGWVRLNFNYFISMTTFAFILNAVDFVANNASLFLGQYNFYPEKGSWKHKSQLTMPKLGLPKLDVVMSATKEHAVVSEEAFPKYWKAASSIAAGLRASTDSGEKMAPSSQCVAEGPYAAQRRLFSGRGRWTFRSERLVTKTHVE